MNKQNKKTKMNHRGSTTALTLGTVAVIGVLIIAVYNNETRASVQEALDPVVDKFQKEHPHTTSAPQIISVNDPNKNLDHVPDEPVTPEFPSEGEPEQPAFKDPIAWLEQALVDLAKKEALLKPRSFKLRVMQNKFDRKKVNALSEEESWEDLLSDLKDAYRTGESKGFPVAFRDYEISDEVLQVKIVQTSQLAEENRKMRTVYARQANRAKALNSKIGKTLGSISQAQRLVQIKLEVARTEKELEGLGDVQEQVGDILDIAESLVNSADHLSPEELRENARPQGFTNEAFLRIMNSDSDNN